LAIFSQILDGAATWVAIDFFSHESVAYGEQHVIPNFIVSLFPSLGFFTFFLLKTILVVVFIKMLQKEKEKEEIFYDLFLCAIIIMGLAPGIRDLFRLLAGV
jgi:uncharacterized membrane protein